MRQARARFCVSARALDDAVNFAQAGEADELLAARAVSKFRQAFEVDIQLRSLFELHTIADIAQYLDTMKWAAQTAEQQVGSSAEESGRDEGFL